MTARHRIQTVVDRLVAETYWIGHTSQCARNLGRAQALAQILDDALPQLAAGPYLGFDPRLDSQSTRTPAGRQRTIAARNSRHPALLPRLPTIPSKLAQNRRRCPTQTPRYRRRNNPQPQLGLDENTFLKVQMTVSSAHKQLSPENPEMLHLDLESAHPFSPHFIPCQTQNHSPIVIQVLILMPILV